MAALEYWIWLSAANVSPRAKAALIEHFGDAEAAYYAAKGVYALIPGIGFLLSTLVLLFYKLKDKDAELMAKCNAGQITREECEAQLSRKY